MSLSWDTLFGEREEDPPGWVIRPAGRYWEGISRPTPTAVRVIAGHSRGDVAEKIALSDRG